MGMTERGRHIKTLENLLSHYKAREQCEGYYDRTLKDDVEVLHYAISSLKTDLKYDMMYEGEDVYTKDDIVAMLTELQLEIEEFEEEADIGKVVMIGAVDRLIQQKINSLKEA